MAYYGLQSLLTLYLSKHLLLSGQAKHVLGLGALQSAFGHGHGMTTPLALASMIFGLFAGSVYLTPIFGGVLADRILGRTRTIRLGAILMALSYWLMMTDRFFLCALAGLALGIGCFKSNIAGQVGDLYALNDRRRATAFQIFFMAVNIAVVLAPLICGTLGQEVGWRWGFLAAALAMGIALATYLLGSPNLPTPFTPRPVISRPPGALSWSDARTTAVLVFLLPILALVILGNQEIFNAYLVWGTGHYDQNLFGYSIPVTWLLAADGLITIVAIALSVMFWRWVAAWRREPDALTKLVIGALILAAAPLILAWASAREAASGHRIGLGWGLAFHIVNDIGVANVLPVGLALYSRAAPPAFAGAILGVYYLHLFLANLLVGWLGGLLDTMTAVQFWLLHAELIACGALGMLVFARLFGRLLGPTSEAEVFA